MAKDPIKAQLDRNAAENKAQLERSENVQPTPTQEENDRAALGLRDLKELDDKEADGSEEQDVSPSRRADAPIVPNAGAKK
jgi:hypothetical protein